MIQFQSGYKSVFFPIKEGYLTVRLLKSFVWPYKRVDLPFEEICMVI
jgi:hypothetical protein